MRPSFLPRLVNDPFDDPGLFISFAYLKRALLFDIGEIQALSPKEILKTSHVFVTHTHMDHFIGFDRLLRLNLGREKQVQLFGPKGFLAHMQGKLAGYAWNLVDNYTSCLTLSASEILDHEIHTCEYRCNEKFIPHRPPVIRPFSGIAYHEPGFTVEAAILDHRLPCLGFSLNERFHVNIIKEKLHELGLTPGPWLTSFKQSLYNETDPSSAFPVKDPFSHHVRSFILGELAEKIARITPGQKIAYITDTAYSEENIEKMVALARGANILFIEAAFLEKDKEDADRKYHLTARQAGVIAREAGVNQMIVFHHSPRYIHQPELIRKEAENAFLG
jgi:ribonuclease Z